MACVDPARAGTSAVPAPSTLRTASENDGDAVPIIRTNVRPLPHKRTLTQPQRTLLRHFPVQTYAWHASAYVIAASPRTDARRRNPSTRLCGKTTTTTYAHATATYVIATFSRTNVRSRMLSVRYYGSHQPLACQAAGQNICASTANVGALRMRAAGIPGRIPISEQSRVRSGCARRVSPMNVRAVMSPSRAAASSLSVPKMPLNVPPHALSVPSREGAGWFGTLRGVLASQTIHWSPRTGR